MSRFMIFVVFWGTLHKTIKLWEQIGNAGFLGLGMTSPYLERPVRSLNQALIDTGRTSEESGGFGSGPSIAEGPTAASPSPSQFLASRTFVALAFLAIVLVGTAVLLKDRGQEQQISANEIEKLNDIAPAAGGSVPLSNEGVEKTIEGLGEAATLSIPGNSTSNDQ